eukprot:gene11363-biopygen403
MLGIMILYDAKMLRTDARAPLCSTLGPRYLSWGEGSRSAEGRKGTDAGITAVASRAEPKGSGVPPVAGAAWVTEREASAQLLHNVRSVQGNQQILRQQ